MDKNNLPNRNALGNTLFTKKQFYQQIEGRLYRALNYLSIYTFIVVVYGGALVTDYLLFALMEWLLSDNVQRYPVVALWFDYAQIGLALLFIIAGVVHGVISTIGQIRLDIELSHEDVIK